MWRELAEEGLGMVGEVGPGGGGGEGESRQRAGEVDPAAASRAVVAEEAYRGGGPGGCIACGGGEEGMWGRRWRTGWQWRAHRSCVAGKNVMSVSSLHGK